MIRFAISLAVLVAVLAQVSPAQVETTIRMSKQEYLAGEPIVMLIEVTNIGEDKVAYGGGCDFDVKMSIAGVQPKPEFSNEGCFTGRGQGGYCGTVDHPPGLAREHSVLWKRLLTGYRLGPGSYTLKASGGAPVRWWLFPTTDPKHSPKYPVEGAQFSGELEFWVRAGSEDELQEAFAPWMKAAVTVKPPDQADAQVIVVQDGPWLAKRAIAEAAPPFAEEFVRKFTKEDQGFTITALKNMNTSSSRQALVQLFAESKESEDAQLRGTIVSALHQIADPEQTDFFAALMTSQDIRLQEDAILAMGRIGGWRGVAELERLQSDDKSVNDTINNALSMTRSADAVPVLIERYRQHATGDSVCGALATLTHLAWCDVPEEGRVRYWQGFWAEHGATMQIYGDDDCSGAYAPQPLRWAPPQRQP